MKRAITLYTRRALLAATLLGALVAFPPLTLQAQGQGVKVIVHKSTKISRLDREEVARIFLGKKTLWESGTRVAPSMLDETLPAIEPFLETTIRKSVVQFHTYWKRLVFSGGGAPPRTFRSSAEVIEFVAREPGGIGVIESGVTDDRVKVIEIGS
jgi:ABC-type phosphate transport system substrate-binding protein